MVSHNGDAGDAVLLYCFRKGTKISYRRFDVMNSASSLGAWRVDDDTYPGSFLKP